MGNMLSTTTGVKEDTRYLDLLKVVLTVGIVFRHASLVDVPAEYGLFNAISKGIVLLTELCVPLFFVISGYLFFLNVPERPDVKWFGNKLWKRVFSLLIPYLIANVLAFLFYWLAMHYTPSLVSGFFGDNWKNPIYVFWTGPINLSLWFIRDLIIICVLSPLIWLLIRYCRWWGVLALGLLWLFGFQKPWTNFYFTLGAGLAILHVDVARRCKDFGPYLLLAMIGSAAAYWNGKIGLELFLLTGLPVGVWLAISAMQSSRWKIDPSWRAWCFFIYLYHYIPVIGCKKAFVQFLHPANDGVYLATYFASALLVLTVLTGLYFAMKKIVPKLTSILVGGK